MAVICIEEKAFFVLIQGSNTIHEGRYEANLKLGFHREGNGTPGD